MYEIESRTGKRECELLALVGAPWQLLDDVDTAGDIAKGDNVTYQQIVERVQAMPLSCNEMLTKWRLILKLCRK